MTRVLVIAAHPDDIEFGASGTVATWTAAGIEVTYCVCTHGEAGTVDGVPHERVAELRDAEQRAAAAELGVREVVFLDHADGRVVASLELRRDLSRVIRQVRPQRVLTWSPEINWAHVATAHPDHRAVGTAAFAAVYPDARNANAHQELLADEGLQPWAVSQLWLADGPGELVNHAVDITDRFPVKLAALAAHRSQTGHLTGLADALAKNSAAVAERHGLAANRFAEAFQVVKTA